jgi:hypothetical protein
VDLRDGGYLDAEDTLFSIIPDGAGGGHSNNLLGRGITTLTGGKARLMRCKMQVRSGQL